MVRYVRYSVTWVTCALCVRVTRDGQAAGRLTVNVTLSGCNILSFSLIFSWHEARHEAGRSRSEPRWAPRGAV
jgi:hypothetical protein